MHEQITYYLNIFQEKDWIVKIFRKLIFRKFVTEKREEADNAMTNQQRYLLGLRVCWILSVSQTALAPSST